MNALTAIVLISLLFQESPIDAYRKADFSQKNGKFDDACRNRIALEHSLIRAGDPAPLRAALGDKKRDVRAFAAAALGILGDRDSIDRLAEVARKDPDSMVRGKAVQALGWLKAGSDVIEAAKSDRAWNVRWLSKVAEGQLKSKIDYAAKVRKAYEAGITRKEMGTARVGSPAPDFSALDIDGKPFKLGDVVKKKIVVLTFQVADW